MAFPDQEAMTRMAQKCKSASLQVVYANTRKKLAQTDTTPWAAQLQEAPATSTQNSATSIASALRLLNRMNGNKEDYYVLVIRKNYWA
ncbi:hypothetical protein SAMN04487941_3438 [Pontibacter akesuensis]|uniref:Uncharacterized protein n=2 Tax=Pontibacter akesuensis TaxID=388950 RepID=A0A1I7K6C5_9BACT|nr:hypothetical protein GCM10007389_30680 [Pontibacter akesuensis]SFU92902.1 hypothetical protein SAMN04487941_3438 [Pontibacter akesuensis]